MNPAILAFHLARDYGPGWVLRRGCYELQVRSGWRKRRFRQRPWDPDECARWLPAGAPAGAEAWFSRWAERRLAFLDPGPAGLQAVLGAAGVERLDAEARDIAAGHLRYFFNRAEETGFPPAWHRSPAGGEIDPRAHGSDLPVFSAAAGDIKDIWEPARFASAFTLGRAYRATGNEEHAETFWRLVESWGDACPPNTGPHWMCGQEIALRIIAWTFGLLTTRGSKAASAARVRRLAGMVAAQADRVLGDVGYARLQRNNHSVSEGAGLWTAGLLFPGMGSAARWREAGRRILERDARELVADDGSFSQHSTNYHRLLLHLYLWAARLGEACGQRFSGAAMARVERASAFLLDLVDRPSGGAPVLGGNDGALALPLSSCDYTDFRPAAGAAHFLFHREKPFARGPWEEALLWLFGDAAAAAAPRVATPPRRGGRTPRGGCCTLGGETAWAVLRVPAFKTRPAHADALHFDLWRGGVNVARDAGTYRYYEPPGWSDALAAGRCHNTVTLAGRDQMERGPRFLWYRWLTARVSAAAGSSAEPLEYLEAEHDGYARLRPPAVHRRAVLRAGEHTWVVVDDLAGTDRGPAVLHWLLDGAARGAGGGPGAGDGVVVVELPGTYGLRCEPAGEDGQAALASGADADAPLGWVSGYYGERRPAASLTLTVAAGAPCRFVSLFAPAADLGRAGFTSADARYSTPASGGVLELHLAAPGASPILRLATWSRPGAPGETLRPTAG